MIKGYRIGFNIWGLVLFIVIMIPNFVWFVVPAPNDILRTESSTEVLDAITSICQVIMIVLLCMIINKRSERRKWSLLNSLTCICCLIYYVSWILYYTGITDAGVVVLLSITPCLAFLFMAIDRKNMIALMPAILFTICHLLQGVVNFIL